MFQSGLVADCVIEVLPHIEGQEKQVFFVFIGGLFSVILYLSGCGRTNFGHKSHKGGISEKIVLHDILN
jgi:hypothetical protein